MLMHLVSIEMKQNLAASENYRVCGYFCICAIFPILITSFFMIYYWSLTNTAAQFNSTHAAI